MIVDPHGSDIALYFNLTFDGPEKVFIQDVDWRIAMSFALDRDSMNEITFLGQGTVRNALPAAEHPFYPGPEYETKFATYEPDKSNEILDGIMGPKDSDGFRTMPDGSRFSFSISTMDAFGGFVDGGEQMCQNFQEVGVRCQLRVVERSLLLTQARANELMSRIQQNDLTAELYFIAFHTLPTSSNFGWANSWATFYESGGESGEEPPAEVQHLLDIYLSASGVPPDKQAEIAREIFAWTIDNAVSLGTVGASGLVSGILVVNDDLVNVPDFWAHRSGLNMPFNAFPDQFWYSSAERRGD